MLTLLNLIDPDRHIDRGVVLLSDTTRGYLITVKPICSAVRMKTWARQAAEKIG